MTVYCNTCKREFEGNAISDRFCSVQCKEFFMTHIAEKGKWAICRGCDRIYFNTGMLYNFCSLECKKKNEFRPLF